MSSWASWEPWLIGGFIALILIGFITRALFGDRARGHPRCFRCGHAFGRDDQMTCTECGWTARSPRDVLRTRRHWRKAVLGAVLLFASAALIRLQAAGGNPMFLAPDRLLIMLLPLDPTADGTMQGPIAEELRRRLMIDELDEAEVDLLFDRIAAGDGWATPGSDAWQARYGGLVNAWRSRLVRPGDPEAATLLSIPPRIDIEVPGEWPLDLTVPAELDVEDWWPIGTECVIELRWKQAKDDGTSSPPIARIGYRNRASVGRPHSIQLPPVNQWPKEPTVEATIQARFVDAESLLLADAGIESTGESDQDGDMPPDIPPFASMPVVRSSTTLLRPLDLVLPDATDWAGDDATDQAIREIFAPGLRRWEKMSRPYAIRFDFRRAADQRFESTLLGFVVEIVERMPDGAELVRRRSRIWMPGGMGPNGNWRSRWGISEEDADALARAFDPTPGSSWFMRIRGDARLARLARASVLNQGGDPTVFTRWWAGEVTRPLRTTDETRRPFIRRWFHPDGVQRPEATDRSQP
jgi:ribosomal protein L37E